MGIEGAVQRHYEHSIVGRDAMGADLADWYEMFAGFTVAPDIVDAGRA